MVLFCFIEMGEIRNLCKQCAANYNLAGYKLKRTEKDIKEPCDICYRMAFEFIIKPKGAKRDGGNQKHVIRKP